MNPDRELERRKAERGGYFWMPCPVCGQEFSGLEHGNHRSAHNTTIPTQVDATFARGRAICPDCTERGVGCRAWAQAEAAAWIVVHCCEFLPEGLLRQEPMPPYRIRVITIGRHEAGVSHAYASDTNPLADVGPSEPLGWAGWAPRMGSQ